MLYLSRPVFTEFEGEEEARAKNSPDRCGTSPRIGLCFNGHIMCCLRLMEADATILPSKASVKQTLFFFAIGNGGLETVQILVQIRADL